MIKKKGKEIDLKCEDNFKIKLGTVDNKKPKSLYVNIVSWIEPIERLTSYKSIIKTLNKKIKKKIFDNIDIRVFEKNKLIVDLDIRESGINYGKKSYMSCEITLYQIHGFKIQEKEIIKTLSILTNKIINEVFNEEPNFKYQKNKQ